MSPVKVGKNSRTLNICTCVQKADYRFKLRSTACENAKECSISVEKKSIFFWEGDIPSSHPAPSASCPPCEPSGCVLGVAYTYVLSIDLLTARISLLAGLQKQCALPTDHCCQYGQDDARVHPVRAPAAAAVT